jgi:hypothetical protein
MTFGIGRFGNETGPLAWLTSNLRTSTIAACGLLR